jgi:3-oxoacyl-[acyl-carrier protein] reductase
MPSLSNKVALITGATRGIGKAIGLRLGQESDLSIIGTATSEEGAASISEYLKTAGIRGRGIVMDISTPADSFQSIESVLEQLALAEGIPAILVNNAGITVDNLFLRMGLDEWTKVIDTNLTGAYRLIHACIRSMVKQRFGRIVNISSVVGVTGNAGQANYAASKAGIIGLTKSLARELGSRGITVNVVAPGFIDTDMTRALSADQHAKLLEQIPMGRMGQPEDIAHVVAFLVSAQAAYITGETVHVNGGMYMC